MTLLPLRPEAQARPRPMRNPGANCYLNSMLQALLACTSVVQRGLENAEYLALTEVGRALLPLLEETAAGVVGRPPAAAGAQPAANRAQLAADYAQVSARPPADPSGIQRALGEPADRSGILRALSEALRAREPGNARFAAAAGPESASECLTLLLGMLDAEGDRPNPVSALFRHTSRVTLLCEACGETSRAVLDHGYIFAAYHVPACATPAEFERLLRADACRVEGFECAGCAAKMSAVRVRQLQRVAELLVCEFAPSGRQAARELPQELRLPAATSGQLRYQLVATISHVGGTSGGHYFAHVRAGEQVYAANDDSVYRAASLTGSPVVMAFYHYAGRG